MTVLGSVASADITGTIYRDFNLNGTRDTGEPPVTGIEIRAYDSGGNVVASATSGSDGSYSLSTGNTSTKFRVELVNVPDYLKAGTESSPTVLMLPGNATHDFGLYNPGQYCQANPDIVLARHTKGGRDQTNGTIGTLLKVHYSDRYDDTPDELLTYQQTGAIYGLAHNKENNITYMSAWFKRHADLGPSGVSAIYVYDHESGTLSLFDDSLPGSDPRNGAGQGYDWEHDTNAYTQVAKTGIGDIDISDDETKLFAVDLYDRKLYVYQLDKEGKKVGNPTGYDIPNPCENAVDFRPMATGFHDGKLYVGVTCTAESTVDPDNADDSYYGPRKGDRSKLAAYVYRFDPDAGTFENTPVLHIPLDYQRGCAYEIDISNTHPPQCQQLADQDGIDRPFVANWLPWQMDADIVFNRKKPGNVGNQNRWLEYPQPLLSDIVFDDDGSMILEIKDVNGERTGYYNLPPDPSVNDDDSRVNGNSYGDILRACGDPQSGWTLESNGGCGGVETGGKDTNEGPGGGEFYWYDNGPGGNGNVNGGQAGHSETTMGGLLHVAGALETITGAMDAIGQGGVDNGLMWLRNDNGQIATDNGDPKRLLISGPVSRDNSHGNRDKFYGKASGIGDLEALCDAPPLEIGDYVWVDTDGDGIQDPDEDPIGGVTVELWGDTDGDGTVDTKVGETQTDANGRYYFGGASDHGMLNGNRLETETGYELRIALNDAALGGRKPTLQDANGNGEDQRDSDGDNGGLVAGYSTIAYRTGTIGSNDYTLDFGFAPLVAIGNRVFLDNGAGGGTADNGIMDSGEAGIDGVKVELYDSSDNLIDTTTTANGGYYYFDNLLPGDYYVKIPASEFGGSKPLAHMVSSAQ
ncbi:SdrD B-like domain-containing protein, partial [Nitratifractor sp.]